MQNAAETLIFINFREKKPNIGKNTGKHTNPCQNGGRTTKKIEKHMGKRMKTIKKAPKISSSQ